MSILIPPVHAALWLVAQQAAARFGRPRERRAGLDQPEQPRGDRHPWHRFGRLRGAARRRVVGATPSRDDVGSGERSGRLRLLGATLVVGGAAFGGAALTGFLRERTTWHPHNVHEASVLVTTGPNAVSRNPMYLAMALGLAGTGLGSPRPWTAVTALGLMGTLTPQIRREERALASVFGQEYDAYRRRVPRWL